MLVPAIIPITWTAQYTGQHRVCWRVQGSGDPYTCTQIATPHPSCTAGQACGYDIPIQVDNETCDQITYEGYVQPTCEDEASMNGRVAFPPVTFIPNPACQMYDVRCENAPVAAINVVSGGDGYDPLSPPNITISGGGGAGATGTVVVGDGAITALAGTPAGTGYSDGFYPACPLVGGSGAGATANVNIAGGIVTSAIIVSGGSGYQDGDIVNPDPGTVGAPTTPADLTVTSDYGEVLAVTVDTPGSGYTSAPAGLIDPPAAGTTATAAVVLEDCAPFTYNDCTGATATPTQSSIPVGSAVSVCSESGAPASPGNQFSVTANGTNCLCNCRDVDIENTNADTVDVTYIDCDDRVQTIVLNSGAGPTNLCIVAGSLTYTENGDSTFSLTDNGACNAVP